jgi:hypothetical protein
MYVSFTLSGISTKSKRAVPKMEQQRLSFSMHFLEIFLLTKTNLLTFEKNYKS